MNIDQQISQVIQKKSGSINAEVVSSHALSDNEKAKLLAALPSLKKIQISYNVDQKLIAGLIIYVGSLVIDLSVQTQLRDFYNSLYENI